MFRKAFIAISILVSFLLLPVHAVTYAAEWSSAGPSGVTNDFNGVWGSSAQDVYAVGTVGIKLHYDGNPERTWEDQGQDSG